MTNSQLEGYFEGTANLCPPTHIDPNLREGISGIKHFLSRGTVFPLEYVNFVEVRQ